jgi:hypothetical protein
VKKCFVFLLAAALSVFLSCCGKTGPAGPAGGKGADATGSGRQIMIFQDGLYPSGAYSGCADTRIWEGSNADTNYGSYTYMQVGSDGTDSKRGLLKFDISAMPPGAVITKTIVTLYCGSVVTGSPEFAFYEIISHDWVEAEATWNDYSTSNAWTTAGGDYNTAAVSNFIAPVSGLFASWEISPAVAQGWLDNSAQNYGLILIAKDETVPGESVFAASESADPAHRPGLSVYYTLP